MKVELSSIIKNIRGYSLKAEIQGSNTTALP
jgi:hypothetical protein